MGFDGILDLPCISKVSFVIYVMGNLLAPSAKHDYATTDFWGALKDPDTIDRFNWCRYVHTLVLEAAQKVRNEVVIKGRVSALTGCHLFLQVLYLDNIDLGGLSMNHNDVPRIKVFNQEILRRMAVSCASRGEQDFLCFISIRHRTLSAYMRSSYESDDPAIVNDVPTQMPPPLAPVLLPYTNELGEVVMVPSENYPLREAKDFAAYMNAKYPFLVKHYVLDYFKQENARMMRDIAQLRQSVLRRNADFFDWFVQNVGLHNVLHMHKKPSTPSNQGSISSIRSDGSTKQVVGKQMLLAQTHTSSCNAAGRPAPTRIYGTGKRGGGDTPDQPVHKRPAHIVPLNTKMANSTVNDAPRDDMTESLPTPVMPHAPVHGDPYVPDKKNGPPMNEPKSDVIDVPSFDLGISFTPAPESYKTPLEQIIRTKPVQSPAEFPSLSPVADEHSANTAKLSPKSATIEHASMVVFEQLAMLDDASSQPDGAMYAEPVREPYERAVVEHHQPETYISFSAQGHPAPDTEMLDMFAIWLKNGNFGKRTSCWIVHPYPKKLLVSAADIHDNFTCANLFGDNLVDAIIRRFNQLDITLGQGVTAFHWRHFLESDFAMLTLGGQPAHEAMSILHQFLHVDYSVPRCRMVIAPVLVDQIWCAYMFEIHTSNIHILDPAHSEARLAAHEFIAVNLISALGRCTEAFYDNWYLSPAEEWKTNYPKLTANAVPAGTCMLQMARPYNGTSLEFDLDQESLDITRKQLIFQALSMANNQADVPGALARIIC
ncbi:unnamed protein product [Urochloa decumbens]|uniref:Uncharacterized protein n=1 Tax=Urochloa decumbens TaxID=240449 RepID=A0ABC9C3A0_9POAL